MTKARGKTSAWLLQRKTKNAQILVLVPSLMSRWGPRVILRLTRARERESSGSIHLALVLYDSHGYPNKQKERLFIIFELIVAEGSQSRTEGFLLFSSFSHRSLLVAAYKIQRVFICTEQSTDIAYPAWIIFPR